MKKCLATGLMFLLVLGALTSSARADKAGDAAVKREVQSFFNKVADMFDKKDMEGVANTVIPGATLKYVNGVEVTIEEWKAKALKEAPNLLKMKSKFTVEKVVSVGDTRIVSYREVHDYVLASEKKNKYRSVSRWTLTLAKTPQGWKAAHFVESYDKLTRNGKVVKPKGSPNVM